MNGEQLYKQLKFGQISKSQLTDQELGDVYKYMVGSKKVSVQEIKPAVADKFNLNNSATLAPYRTPLSETPKISGAPKKPPVFNNTRPEINNIPSRSISTNPENELVDILSNLSMGEFKQLPSNNQIPKRNAVKVEEQEPNLLERIGYSLNSIGKNFAGGNISTIGTSLEQGNQAVDNMGRSAFNYMPTDYNKINNEINPKENIEPNVLQNYGDKLVQSAQQDTIKGKQGLGKVGSVVYDLFTGAGQMAADIGTAAVAGVGMLPVMASRVYGQSASEVRQQGGTLDQQIVYGTLSAGIETATEKMFSGLPYAKKLMGGGLADNAVAKVATKLAQGISSSPRLLKAFTYLINMAGEGAEEAISEILSPIAKRMSYDPDADWATKEEILYSALLGAGISGIMGGGVLFQGNEATPTQTQSVYATEDIEPNLQGFQDTIDTGLNQLYSVLDNETDEQAINTMISNLEKVKELTPVLTSYIDNHIAKLNSYKFVEQPTTNDNIEVEQTFNEDTNVAQNSFNDVADDIEATDTQANNVVEAETPIEEQEEITPIEQSLDEIVEDNKVVENPVIEPTANENIPTEQLVSEDNNVVQNTDSDVVGTQTVSNMPTEQEQPDDTPIYKKPLGEIIKGDFKPTDNRTLEEFTDEELTSTLKFFADRKATALPDVNSTKSKVIGDPIGNLEHNIEILKTEILRRRNTNNEIPETEVEQEPTETNVQAIEQPTTNETETSEQIIEEENKVVEKAKKPKQTYRYYLTQRPPSPGTFPKGNTNVVSFDDKTDGAWGYVEYDKPLTEQQISDYELTDNIDNYVKEFNVTDKNLADKIKREINEEAFGKAMSTMGYKTLEDIDTHKNDKPKNIRVKKDMLRPDMYRNQRHQFDALEEKFNNDIRNDKKFIQDVIDKYNKKQEENLIVKRQEKSFEKEDWQVIREDYINRGSQYRNGRFVGDIHKEKVEQALKENKDVPEEVLKDYPELTNVTKTKQVAEETKEEQIEETKEELKERVEDKQKQGIKLTPNETKISNFLKNNDTVFDYMYDLDTVMEFPIKNDGFDSQQRRSLVAGLINGLRENKSTIHVEIPRDGTFDIVNDYDTVSVIINRLGVKVKSLMPKGAEKILSNANRITIGKDFFTDGYVLLKADNNTLSEIKEQYKDKITDNFKTLENAFNLTDNRDGWIEITKNPIEAPKGIPSTQIKGKSYIFDVSEKIFGIEDKNIKLLNRDGNKFYYFADSKNNNLIRVENSQGNVIGAILSMNLANKNLNLKDGNMFTITKQNFFSKPKENKIKGKSSIEDTKDSGQEETKISNDVPEQFQGQTPTIVEGEAGFVQFKKGNPQPINQKFTYDDEQLEEQHKKNRISKVSRLQKIKEWGTEFKKAATRTFRELDPKLSENAEALKELIRYPKIKAIAGDNATRILNNIIQKENEELSAEEYNRFERYVFLADLMEEIKEGRTLPGLWTEETVTRNYEALKSSLTENIQKAIDRRTRHWNEVVKDYSDAMEAVGFDVKDKFTKKNYFRHQVLEYVNAKNLAGSGNKVKVKTRGFTKQRQGTEKAINEDYLQAEYEVLASMEYDKEVALMLKRIDNNYGIKEKLKAQAREENANNKGNDEPKVTWKDFVPEDYSVWQPIPGKHMFTANTISEKFAEALINDTLDELSPSEKKIREVLAQGTDKEQFVIPTSIATSLDHAYNQITSNDDVIHKILSYPMGIWKSWVLTINPKQVIKYNIRNITGDADGLMAAGGIKAFNPKLYVGKSTRELFNAMKYGRFTKEMLEFRDKGGFQDLMYAQELGAINDMKLFKTFNKQDTDNLIRKITKNIPGLSSYTDFTENMTNYREGILRYSAYLYFKDDIIKNKGNPSGYGASTRQRIDGLKSIEDKAYQLSKDALGAYDEITEVGQSLRKYLIPFHSWNEVNMKRYKRIFQNTIGDIKAQEQIGKKVMSGLKLTGFTGVQATRLIGKMAIRVFFTSAMLMAWNRLMRPDDDDELSEDIRNTPHLTLGRDEDGNVIYFSRLGALNDVFEWFGLDQLPTDFEKLMSGRKTAEEQAEDMTFAPINKIFNSITPFLKTPLELLSKTSFYPDVREPSNIRNNWLYVWQSLGLKDEYSAIEGLPMDTTYPETWIKAIVYKSNPDTTAYYRAVDLRYQFQEKVLKQSSQRMIGGSEKSEALYYYKMALKYDDKKAAEKYFKKYYELGGTDKGLKTSLSSLNPVYGLNKEELEKFYKWLNVEEREDVEQAIGYYSNLIKEDKE